MALRVGMVLLILSLAAVAESSFSFDDGGGFNTVAHFDLGSHLVPACNGQVGECTDEDDDDMMTGSDNDDDNMMMSSQEVVRRTLAQRRRISYGALKRNQVPCSRRGQSYYNCNKRRGVANPYSRGCSRITGCARVLW